MCICCRSSQDPLQVHHYWTSLSILSVPAVPLDRPRSLSVPAVPWTLPLSPCQLDLARARGAIDRSALSPCQLEATLTENRKHSCTEAYCLIIFRNISALCTASLPLNFMLHFCLLLVSRVWLDPPALWKDTCILSHIRGDLNGQNNFSGVLLLFS